MQIDQKKIKLKPRNPGNLNKDNDTNKSKLMRLDVGDKVIHCRGWKGKEKKKFIASLKQAEINEEEVLESLVYDCIEEDVVLSTEEFKYVLSRIRAFSLGEDIDIEFYCENCGETYTKTFQLKDIITYSYKELPEINVSGAKIKLGPIRNKTFYEKMIAEDEEYDFLLRIEKFNDNDHFNLEELINLMDNLDVQVLTEIYQIYEDHRFKINDIHSVTCQHCEHQETYQFDELPGFFPESWFQE